MYKYWGILAIFWGVAQAAPQKIASLDICADYYLALFNEDAKILYTHQAKDGYSLPIDIANNASVHHGRLEEIIAYNPDMILKSYLAFGDIAEKIQKYPLETITLSWPTDLEGLKTLHNQLDNILKTKQAPKFNGKLNSYLDKKRSQMDKNMLILGSGGFTIKQGTHYDILFEILGVKNYHQDAGYGMINIEKIISQPPDMIVTIGQAPNRPQLADSNITHKALKKLNIPIYDISDSFTICPSIELITTAERLKKEMKDD